MLNLLRIMKVQNKLLENANKKLKYPKVGIFGI